MDRDFRNWAVLFGVVGLVFGASRTRVLHKVEFVVKLRILGAISSKV